MFSYFQFQKDLIREVEMGPFKHTLDDGLDIRKVIKINYVGWRLSRIGHLIRASFACHIFSNLQNLKKYWQFP